MTIETPEIAWVYEEDDSIDRYDATIKGDGYTVMRHPDDNGKWTAAVRCARIGGWYETRREAMDACAGKPARADAVTTSIETHKQILRMGGRWYGLREMPKRHSIAKRRSQ